MAADNGPTSEDRENQVWSAIAVFEQIVQTIENDRVSLEALSHAYEQVGDHTRAREYLIRLANVVVDEEDRDAAATVLERIKRFAGTDAEAAEAEQRIDHFLSMGGLLPSDATAGAAPAEGGTAQGGLPDAAKTAEILKKGTPVAAELSFAWNLFQAGELNQEEYASVAQDLTELSAADKLVTVSVLHVLHDRGSRHLDRILLYASRTYGLPVLPLSLFDAQHDAFILAPLEFMVRQGVVIFEMLGKDVLVGVLNPFNTEIRKDVETLVGRRCHFYLVPPSDFDGTIESIRTKLATDAKKE